MELRNLLQQQEDACSAQEAGTENQGSNVCVSCEKVICLREQNEICPIYYMNNFLL